MKGFGRMEVFIKDTGLKLNNNCYPIMFIFWRFFDIIASQSIIYIFGYLL